MRWQLSTRRKFIQSCQLVSWRVKSPLLRRNDRWQRNEWKPGNSTQPWLNLAGLKRNISSVARSNLVCWVGTYEYKKKRVTREVVRASIDMVTCIALSENVDESKSRWKKRGINSRCVNCVIMLLGIVVVVIVLYRCVVVVYTIC